MFSQLHSVKIDTKVEGESLTVLLRQVKEGDKDALDSLVPIAYAELRRLADSYLRRERSDHTLQPTALIHEAYLRLVDQDQPDYRSRSHFFGVAAQLMRQILVDHARTRNAGKRGGGEAKIPLESVAEASQTRPESFLDLDLALRKLEERDPRKARVIEMRFFGGLTAEESAEVLQVSVETIRRDLRLGQAWLQRELARTSPLPV
ncbi:MAG TPA: sigma-70 family RNA polymerase sigma factor [Bryobacteraceae bacterium]|jgi:RNA polymerase sigma factor (TIGR02999 family)|nr:sigma-70 family RNA polymerase sigma factor [Bryobacteraceae bacterium]